MHYKIEGKINLPIRLMGDFLEAMPGWPVEQVEGSSFEITSATLPARPTIVSLRPAR